MKLYGKGVMVRTIEEETGLLSIPEAGAVPSQKGVVFAVGFDCEHTKIGDQVLHPQRGGIKVEYNGTALLYFSSEDSLIANLDENE